MSSLQAPMELRAIVTGSSGRVFTTTVVTSKETWDQASGGALVPLAVREQASALIMRHARAVVTRVFSE